MSSLQLPIEDTGTRPSAFLLLRRVNLRIAREEDDCCEVALLVILELVRNVSLLWH